MAGERRIITEELHRSARRNYPKRKVRILGFDDLWQIDLVDMQAYKDQNDGYGYILMVIDAFSKYGWAIPLKSKAMTHATQAFEKILKDSGRSPKNLQADKGTEFFNKTFKVLMRRKKINLYSTFSNLKASIVERWNRTIKTWMWKEFTFQSNAKWREELLKSLVEKYNNRIHRTIETS